MDELSDAHEYDLSTLTNEEDNAYIGFCKNLPSLISFSNLEKTLQFMIYQMAKQEETIKKQAQSIQDTLALRQEIQSLDSRVDVQEKLLAQKDAELTEMRKAQDRLFTENLNLWRNVRSLEVDLEATKTNAGLNIDAVGSWRAEAQRNTESTQQLAIDLGTAFQKMETIQHDLQLIVQGQPHERIAKIERDLEKKIDLHKFAKELEVRDQLRKQTAEVLDSLSKRVNEQNACVDVLKASLDEKIGKDYVDSLWQRKDSKSVDYEKVQAIIDEKLDGLKSQQMNQARLQGDDAERLKPLQQIESRVYTAEGDIRSCREEISHNQELIARLTSTISCLATESRLQIVAKAVRELEKRTNGLDTAKILEKLEEKTDKVTFNVFKDNVSQYIFDASSGINASRSTFKCLSCDKPGLFKDLSPGRGEADGSAMSVIDLS
eukprot:TRINITY_DN8960_c0_g1_i1.p1 TRINITY_DN8960_c0_g1~~TRINITY_DN8960_c0_g1_i1.p1  ORF type:complete len:434 (+),score=119.02 TRINITY_DN8960_c0_g1_i1:53-1354(+)